MISHSSKIYIDRNEYEFKMIINALNFNPALYFRLDTSQLYHTTPVQPQFVIHVLVSHIFSRLKNCYDNIIYPAKIISIILTLVCCG